MFKSGATRVLCAVTVASLSGAASAGMLDFSGVQHGEILTNQFQASQGVTISAINFNRPHDLAIAFNTNLSGTADPDLEGPFTGGGNIDGSTDFGMAMILSQNSGDSQGDGVIDNPNDEGGRPAGQFILDFSSPQTQFGFDLLDVESVNAEDGEVAFYSGASLIGAVGFGDFVDNGSAWYDASVDYGDHSANRIAPIEMSAFGAGSYDRVVITMGGSGAVDNITFVPTPGAAVAMLGFGGFAATRRRR